MWVYGCRIGVYGGDITDGGKCAYGVDCDGIFGGGCVDIESVDMS